MFSDGADLPIFSGTPQEAIERRFVPEDHSFKQVMLPRMPAIDFDYVRELDRQKRRRRSKGEPVAEARTLWQFEETPDELSGGPLSEPEQVEEGAGQSLADLLAGYHLDIVRLRQLAAMGSDLNELLRQGTAPPEVVYLLSAMSTLLRPSPKERSEVLRFASCAAAKRSPSTKSRAATPVT
jgi:hypothetical protein